ncbi:hypothetical protein [Rhizobium leguminosarum]|uniref:Uncharacterized protein n=1 Tax=Rhizobium leguminosarum bv. viciae TaxID=387 RepID=A0A8G2MUC4_RHILV|nr:hypothetical protein [Rhizobium leguminosarum]MBY5619966.1 hypothetical protein [Rhizobium leguminosarum]NKK18618.1 hypothetical protein [Rhizobium leguminosarum bv. viciae]TBX98095.1 hypothetical protein E0H31_04090 [Rhizobium leguminosarum bv. viciae]TBZ10931.1 hypothetical protein E0H52_32535 [Rhizobium leguminosarum bv. viciae]
MKLKVSIDRLRRLVNQKNSTRAIERAAWEVVLSARREVARARTELNKYENPALGTFVPTEKDRAGGWSGGKPGKGTFRPPTPDHQSNARHALGEAEEALVRAEENHAQASDDWNLVHSLALRGYDFAREHISVPSDISESFN